MQCENCQKEHSGTYGSGRFCGCSCARSFATKINFEEICKRKSASAKSSEKVLKANQKRMLTREIRVCPLCNNSFEVMKGSKQKRHTEKVYCSLSCKMRSPSHREKARDSTRQAYALGKDVYGGYTKWHIYKGIKVQGTYEYRTCIVLDSWLALNKIKGWEYTSDRFPYKDASGSEHRYLLDFKVYENDGSFYYLEVKGWVKPNDPYKWEAVRAAGFRLDVWFKNDLDRLEIQTKHGEGGGIGRHTTL